MNIVFLDMDGVLNDQTHIFAAHKICIRKKISSYDHTLLTISNDHVQRLNAITEATDAKIVWISSWSRAAKKEDAQKLFVDLNIKAEYIDRVHDVDNRANGIRTWLANHPEVENYLILDDCQICKKAEDEPLRAHWLRTSYSVNGIPGGILESDVYRAIEILSGDEESILTLGDFKTAYKVEEVFFGYFVDKVEASICPYDSYYPDTALDLDNKTIQFHHVEYDPCGNDYFILDVPMEVFLGAEEQRKIKIDKFIEDYKKKDANK